MKIKILPPHLANKIAAGEVVERPASVVKEMLENAIDAGADEIKIEIENGGLKRIKITDNGEGMSPEDAKMCFERHATSKINCEADLYSIRSLGFRGEAMASIASVAMIKMTTRKKGNIEGYEIEINGGEIFKDGVCGSAEGTIFDVENLFFNTPARKKFLKTIVTEFGHISNVFLQTALGFYDRAFSLTHNGQTHFNLPKNQTLKERIYSLLGKDFFENIIEIDKKGEEIGISGYLGMPSITRNSRKHQYLFVNQRAIQSSTISKAVQDAYHSLLPQGRYPIFIFDLTINPLEVDVNIHPRKLEVRFLHQQEVYNFIKNSVKETLNSENIAPKISDYNFYRSNLNQQASLRRNEIRGDFSSNLDNRNNSYYPEKKSNDYYSDQLFSVKMNEYKQEDWGNKSETIALSKNRPHTKIKPIRQVKNSYLICEDDEGIILIDQHAAHERINYMKLMAAFENDLESGLLKQQLLTPISIDLTLEQQKTYEENADIMNKLGFEIEHFGDKSFLIRAIPSCLNNSDLEVLLVDILDDLAKDGSSKELEKRKEYLINYVACRSSIKFGRPLEYDEQIKLLDDLENLSQKYTCPHGRPTMMRLNYKDLEKNFGRT